MTARMPRASTAAAASVLAVLAFGPSPLRGQTSGVRPAPVAATTPANPTDAAPQRKPATLPAGRKLPPPPPPVRPGSFEVSGGVHWLAPASLGESAATFTPNASGSRYTYFRASARMGGAPALDARVTYNVARRLAVEGGALIGRPTVNITVADDAEGAAGFTAPGERIWQYVFEANVLLFPPQATFGKGRGRGFVLGGAGYLRQLHAGRFSVDTGTVYSAGGGVKYYFSPGRRGFVKAYGVRADVRAYYRRGGFSFGGGNGWTTAVGAAGIVGF